MGCCYAANAKQRRNGAQYWALPPPPPRLYPVRSDVCGRIALLYIRSGRTTDEEKRQPHIRSPHRSSSSSRLPTMPFSGSHSRTPTAHHHVCSGAVSYRFVEPVGNMWRGRPPPSTTLRIPLGTFVFLGGTLARRVHRAKFQWSPPHLQPFLGACVCVGFSD